MIRIKKGLDLPIVGAPEQKVYEAPKTTHVAVTGQDYVGMKPTMLVKEGDHVKKGQKVFECKKTEGVVYTAPAAGKIVSIDRGARRVFQTLVVQVDDNEEALDFGAVDSANIPSLSKEQVTEKLVESGQWTSLRTRPFSRVPAVGTSPRSIFVTAMDTNPLAADPTIIVAENTGAFNDGLNVLSKLTEGKVYVCHEAGAKFDIQAKNNVEVKTFSGIHPAGNVGTHIHFIDPVSANKTVWHVGYQDVIAIGKLFTTGKLFTDRIVAVCGPQVKTPRLMKTRAGADLNQLLKDQIGSDENRIVSGSVFNGRTVHGPFKYLSRYANQVTVIKEGREREFMGWAGPGFDKFSVKKTFLSSFLGSKKFPFTSTTHGSHRAMVPIGMFEDVMPLDILPTQLLRAIATNDTDYAQQLGVLELDEEDLALCTFVDPGKVDYGPILRENLEIIEKDG